jgi:hypothetical protein
VGKRKLRNKEICFDIKKDKAMNKKEGEEGEREEEERRKRTRTRKSSF